MIRLGQADVVVIFIQGLVLDMSTTNAVSSAVVVAEALNLHVIVSVWCGDTDLMHNG